MGAGPTTGRSSILCAVETRVAVPHQRPSKGIFVRDNPLTANLTVNGDYRRMPTSAAQSAEQVVEPGLDSYFNIRKVRRNSFDKPNS